MDFYLDHNIYIYSLIDKSIVSAVDLLKKSVNFCYSPAHIEEVYKALKKGDSNYLENKKNILSQISKFTNDMEYLPSMTSIIIKKESPFICYERIVKYDTTQRIEIDGKHKYKVDKEHYKELCDKEKKYQNISNIEFDKIWDYEDMVNAISQLNTNMKDIRKKHNNRYENSVFKLCGVDKDLPEDLKIYSGMYSKIKDSHKVLEFIIEILFRILNINGYNAEKKEDTTISGIHDVSHAIYATKADKLFTVDRKFFNKCKAVYYFLQVDTEVILCSKENISEILMSYNECCKLM